MTIAVQMKSINIKYVPSPSQNGSPSADIPRITAERIRFTAIAFNFTTYASFLPVKPLHEL